MYVLWQLISVAGLLILEISPTQKSEFQYWYGLLDKFIFEIYSS